MSEHKLYSIDSLDLNNTWRQALTRWLCIFFLEVCHQEDNQNNSDCTHDRKRRISLICRKDILLFVLSYAVSPFINLLSNDQHEGRGVRQMPNQNTLITPSLSMPLLAGFLLILVRLKGLSNENNFYISKRNNPRRYIYTHSQASGNDKDTAAQCDSIAQQFNSSPIVVCSMGVGHGYYSKLSERCKNITICRQCRALPEDNKPKSDNIPIWIPRICGNYMHLKSFATPEEERSYRLD
jgi:hypothetical protein